MDFVKFAECEIKDQMHKNVYDAILTSNYNKIQITRSLKLLMFLKPIKR